MICGANATMRSVVVPSMAGRAQAAFGLAGMSRSAIGRARAAMATVTGSRISTAQVSSAEATWVTYAFWTSSVSARRAARASTGTIALASAPPRASS